MEQIAAAHKKNTVIWIAILSGMVILSAVVYLLDSQAIFTPIPDSRQTGQILFITAVLLAGAILILKRSIFLPEKVVLKIPKSTAGKNQDDVLLARIRFNYLIVWSLGEAILIIGFINYIFTTDFNNFLIFAIVGIYSLLINKPREDTLHRCIDMLQKRE